MLIMEKCYGYITANSCNFLNKSVFCCCSCIVYTNPYVCLDVDFKIINLAIDFWSGIFLCTDNILDAYSWGCISFMAKIKPQALLQQSKKKKGPRSISVTTIVLYGLLVVLLVFFLLGSYRHFTQRFVSPFLVLLSFLKINGINAACSNFEVFLLPNQF